MKLDNIAIIGAGMIGTSVACDMLLHGLKVTLVDNKPEQLKRAHEEIMKVLRYAPILNKNLPSVDPEEAEALLCLTTDIKKIADCGFVVENVPEEWDIKVPIYKQIEEICDPEVRVGMNTSCTPITKMGSTIQRPENIIGVHFMNPVYLKDTVEVINGINTSEETHKVLDAVLAKLNKKSIVVNDFPGFVSNRISHLFMNEAAFVVQDQVASPAQVDAIFKKCFGHSMGPLETADLIGLDTVMKSIDALYENFNDSKFRCCPLLRQKVHAGHLGRKAGKGFYDYPEI